MAWCFLMKKYCFLNKKNTNFSFINVHVYIVYVGCRYGSKEMTAHGTVLPAGRYVSSGFTRTGTACTEK